MADPHVAPAPRTPRDAVVDVLHGVPVADPYRWLEDGDDPLVADWVAAHNQRTRKALDAQPQREAWHRRLCAFTGLRTVMGATVCGDRLFVLERAPGADQFALLVGSAVDAAAPMRLLLDPAGLAADAAAAIDWYSPSPDGALVAYGVSHGGDERSTLRVMATDTGLDLADSIPDIRYGDVTWLPDNSGFWYCAYPPGDEYHRHVRFHAIGTDASADTVTIDHFPTAECWPSATASADGRYLLVHVQVGWGHVDVLLLDVASGRWHDVSRGVEAQNGFCFHRHGDGWLLAGVTTVNAPNGRVVIADVGAPTAWREVVPEGSSVVRVVASFGQHLAVVEADNAIETIRRVAIDGTQAGTIGLPSNVAVQSLSIDDTTDGPVAFVTVSRFEAPPMLLRCSADGAVAAWGTAADADIDLRVEHVQYPSLDGTMIGLFIIRRADVVPSADTPLILNGYGGFFISESPTWIPNLAAWCSAGGVYAIAGLRGGSEHGEAWHRAGRREVKQNVFDDFHAAGDWLVAKGYTSHDRLALVGGSNGGLLVGAALTQRPDVARAVWCAVPLLDMIRFPRFLIARLWTDEYGDPDVPAEFEWLRAYSPYHNVREGQTYPAVLFTTAEGDSRVDPLHARKMAALMIHAAADQTERPVLLHQAGRAGHGVGKPATMRIDEGADALTFLSWQLGGPQP